MKKFLLLIALIGMTLGAVAQEETNLPQKGDFSVELGFNPFGNNFESFRLTMHATVAGLALGFEGHWFPHRKIDLYAGPSLGFAIRHSSRDWKEADENGDYYKFSFEVGTGINYYLVKGLYLGAEFGLLVNHIRYRDFQEGVDGPNATTISFEACPSILVGWKF